MYYNHDTLAKLSTKASYDVDLSRMGPKTANAVIKSLRSGIIESTSGKAATYHDIIVDKLNVPALAFSKRGRYWDRLFVRNAPLSFKEGLREWWNLDRVTFRMEHPDQYQDMAATPWRSSELKEPDWGRLNSMSMSILGTKNLDVFNSIVKDVIADQEYIDKIESVIPLIKEGRILVINYAGA